MSYDGARPSDLRVFGHAVLREQFIILTFELASLLAILFSLLEQFDKCSFPLVRLLELGSKFLIR